MQIEHSKLLTTESRPTRTADEETVPDPAWNEFPRTTFDLAQLIVTRPQDLEARELFRHDRLNKSDICIPPREREGISAVVGIQPEHLAALRRAVTESSSRELQLLIEAGLARRVTLASYYESLGDDDKRHWDEELQQARARWRAQGVKEAEVAVRERNFGIVAQGHAFPGGVFASNWADGAVHGARLVDMPQTRHHAELCKIHFLAFARKLIVCFEACQTLTSPDGQLLMERISKLLDSHYPTAR